MSDDVFQLVGTSLHGKYRVDDVVGEGGFGVVYRGFHLSFEQPIAIKCLKMPSHFTAEARQTFLERFREEGKLLAKLASHGSVTRVYDFAVTKTADDIAVPYLVLEWLEGRELSDVIAEGGPIPEAEAIGLLRPAVDALAFAHEMGIAHRDIKPDNLFVTESHRGPTLKVLDFGIAKVMQEGDRITQLATKTSSGFRAFTPTYAAPEQMNSATFGATGPWTDVHAIGLILTELVMGKRALDAPTAAELYLQATAPSRPTPRSKGGAVSEAFESLCARAMARDPRDRFPDASALLAAMDDAQRQLASDEAANAGRVFSAAEHDAEKTALERAATALPAVAPTAGSHTAEGVAAPPAALAQPPPPAATPPQDARYGSYAAPLPVSEPTAPPSRWGCWVVIALSILSLPITLMVLFADEIVAALDESSEPDEEDEEDEDDGEPEELPEGASCVDHASCEVGCSAERGEDCLILAHLLRTGGKGARIDKERAFRLYEDACLHDGDGDACTEAGIMLLDGEGGRFRRDGPRAVELLEQGCNHQTPEGCRQLGLIAQDGRVGSADVGRALDYFLLGCRVMKHADSCADGARLAKRLGDAKLERAYREQACLRGREDMCDVAGDYGDEL